MFKFNCVQCEKRIVRWFALIQLRSVRWSDTLCCICPHSRGLLQGHLTHSEYTRWSLAQSRDRLLVVDSTRCDHRSNDPIVGPNVGTTSLSANLFMYQMHYKYLLTAVSTPEDVTLTTLTSPCWFLLLILYTIFSVLVPFYLQCFDTVGWAAGRASGP